LAECRASQQLTGEQRGMIPSPALAGAPGVASNIAFRAIHRVTQHVAVAPSSIEMIGQYLLGLGLQERR